VVEEDVMNQRVTKYPPGEIMKKGRDIYNRLIRTAAESANIGRLVAIDVDSEEYEIGDNSSELTKRLLARRPAAWIAVMRIGGGAVHRIGFVSRRGAK
jgi:hypothetical protein